MNEINELTKTVKNAKKLVSWGKVIVETTLCYSKATVSECKVSTISIFRNLSTYNKIWQGF